MTRSERLYHLALGAFVVVFVAGAMWAQWWSVHEVEPIRLKTIVVEDWLPREGEATGRYLYDFPAPPTAAGLSFAIRQQWYIARTLEDNGYHVASTCAVPPILGAVSEPPPWRRHEIFAIDTLEPNLGSAEVLFGSRDFSEPWDRREIWLYKDGSWRQLTCAYRVGPDVPALLAPLRLAETGIAGDVRLKEFEDYKQSLER